MATKGATHGTVVRSTGSWYQVETDDGRLVECKVKGNFRLRGIRSTNPVAVGDGVEIVANESGTAFIVSIDERRNYIIRKASNLSKQSHILAANLDMALLLVTVSHPDTSTTFIDRFLASAEAYRVLVALAFNKWDCQTPEEQDEARYRMHVYAEMDYPCFALSAATGQGVDALRPLLQGKTTLLAGHSGVGKSTLLNRLIPSANARTASLSDAYDTGVHTTTFSELYRLPDGGALIDVPGVKGFGTFNITPEELSHYFRDIFALSTNCRFNNCTHTHEPGCAVLQALDDHRLAPFRYQSYLNMLGDQGEAKYRPAY